MNQPKFKFGDKVTDGKVIFVIETIKHSANFAYLYWGDNTATFTESDLELYQEPQKKKLYAYYISGEVGQIVFACTSDVKHASGNWNRVPEYDIEYPEVKE